VPARICHQPRVIVGELRFTPGPRPVTAACPASGMSMTCCSLPFFRRARGWNRLRRLRAFHCRQKTVSAYFLPAPTQIAGQNQGAFSERNKSGKLNDIVALDRWTLSIVRVCECPYGACQKGRGLATNCVSAPGCRNATRNPIERLVLQPFDLFLL